MTATPHLLFAQSPAVLDTAQIEQITGLKGVARLAGVVRKVREGREVRIGLH